MRVLQQFTDCIYNHNSIQKLRQDSVDLCRFGSSLKSHPLWVTLKVAWFIESLYIIRCEDIATQLVKNMESGNLVLAFGGGLQKFRTVQNGGNFTNWR